MESDLTGRLIFDFASFNLYIWIVKQQEPYHLLKLIARKAQLETPLDDI